jgi:3',5'-cyclic AMP phosphodiesterase CpdA
MFRPPRFSRVCRNRSNDRYFRYVHLKKALIRFFPVVLLWCASLHGRGGAPARAVLAADRDAAAVAQAVQRISASPELRLPNELGSVKFAAIGDNGTGGQPEYEIAQQMTVWHEKFPYDMVIMLGDNMYGSQEPADFVVKFERPYKPLLDKGVRFYAALGNHDRPTNVFYAPFNMNGQRYYTFARRNVQFFVLDSDALDPKQRQWIELQLRDSRSAWKICYFHHPLYSDGGRHGPSIDLRVVLEPLFVKYGVNIVFSGHDHVYERLMPQKGIHYFVSGAGGQLRKGNLKPSSATAAGYDQDQSFMLNEIAGDDFFFQVISRTGQTVDSGRYGREAQR